MVCLAGRWSLPPVSSLNFDFGADRAAMELHGKMLMHGLGPKLPLHLRRATLASDARIYTITDRLCTCDLERRVSSLARRLRTELPSVEAPHDSLWFCESRCRSSVIKGSRGANNSTVEPTNSNVRSWPIAEV